MSNDYTTIKKTVLLSLSHNEHVSVSHPVITFPPTFAHLLSRVPISASASHEVTITSSKLRFSHFITWTLGTSYLSRLTTCVSGMHSSPRTEPGRIDTGILSVLTQARGVKWGMSFALPLSSAVPRAQTLEQVTPGVGLGPGISNTVGGQSILVITAI